MYRNRLNGFLFLKVAPIFYQKGGHVSPEGKKRWSNQQQDTVKIRFFFILKGARCKQTRQLEVVLLPYKQTHAPSGKGIRQSVAHQ